MLVSEGEAKSVEIVVDEGAREGGVRSDSGTGTFEHAEYATILVPCVGNWSTSTSSEGSMGECGIESPALDRRNSMVSL